MGYKRGQILIYTYPENEASNIINGYHRVVTLHKRETPYNTILIAPITSAESLNVKDKIPSNYVKLLETDYPFVLDHDSYINLDMTISVDEEEINVLERYNKTITATLNDLDLYQLDYKITLTYELNRYLENEYSKRITLEFENVITYIDESIKSRIADIILKSNSPDLLNDVIAVIDDLVNQLKTTYLGNKVKI